MPNKDAELYRQKADEFKAQAEESIHPLDKAAWLALAGEWIALAERLEERQKRGI